MISRKTIFSFLLMLLVSVGIFAWNAAKRDECDQAGPDRTHLEVPVGQSGRRVLVVNCSDWLPRQPVRVLVWCFADAALAVVFCLSLLTDAVAGNRWRSQWKQGQLRR